MDGTEPQAACGAALQIMGRHWVARHEWPTRKIPSKLKQRQNLLKREEAADESESETPTD